MSMAAFARGVAQRFHHRGCLISPDYLDLAADLREIAATDLDEVLAAERFRLTELAASFGLGDIAADKPFAFSQGVAIIPIHGILINKMSWGSSYATGYNYIRNLYQAAVGDRDVRAIVYDVNSPGGIGAGCPECATDLFRREKPSLAVVDARCYSAAYWLSSAAHRIAVTPSGGVGSIGVVAMHVDYSALLANDGIKVSFIIAGEEKVDGNPYEALSPRARATIQRDVDGLYGQFVQAAARHRTGLSEAAVRATEARCYLPDEAQGLGLIDQVASPSEALHQFLADQNATGGITMTTQAAQEPQPGADDQAAAIRTAVADALRADRERQSAIRTSPEAEGREALAEHLALNTELPAELCIGILAKAAKAPPASRDRFTAAMSGTANPNVGADNPDADAGGNGEGGTATVNRILSDYQRVSGNKVRLIGSAAA